MGSAVAHYTTKRDRLVALLKQEDNENVRKWLNEYIDDVNLQIERSKIQEERDDFHNPPV
jgi:LPS O-antigen subunit length determinant protein (WzzB/FepE family)